MVCKGVPPKSQGFRHCNFLSDCHSLTMTTSFCRSPYIILPGFCFKALAEHYELKCDSLKEIDVRIKDFYHTKKLPDQLLLKFDPFTISTKSLPVHRSTKEGRNAGRILMYNRIFFILGSSSAVCVPWPTMDGFMHRVGKIHLDI